MLFQIQMNFSDDESSKKPTKLVSNNVLFTFFCWYDL